MEVQTKPLVIIQCLVYNHEPYLRQCLDGFVMQKTNFPFYAVVHDDASTDNSAAIIREYAEKYPDIIHPIYETENQYSKKDGSLPRIMREACKDAKYIAMCEGDDYWTDPFKLQKQVDFLEANPDYSLCCHRYRIYNQNSDTWEDDYVKDLFRDRPEGFAFTNKENLRTWITKTMTLMYRRDCLDEIDLTQYKYLRDVHVNYHLLRSGKGYCMPDVGAVYRKHNGGVFSSLDREKELRVGFLIYREIYEKNQEDVFVKEAALNYFEYLSSKVYEAIKNRDVSTGLYENIKLCHSPKILGCKGMSLFYKRIIKAILNIG